MDDLIRRLQERIRRSPAVECDALCGRCNEAGEELPPRPPNPPVPLAVLEALERELGFRLPTLLRRFYTEVADGGCGPDWGINRLRHPPGADIELWWDQEMSVEGWFRLYRQERAKGEPAEHARIGISLPPVSGDAIDQTPAEVKDVTQGSAGAKAGLRKGDLITKVDDIRITSNVGVIAAIRGFRPGQTVTVTYERGGKSRTTDVTLDSDNGEGAPKD